MNEDAAKFVNYSKMKQKRDQQMDELEKIYDKCLRMHFQMARDKLDLVNLWESVEKLKEKEASCGDEMRQQQEDWFVAVLFFFVNTCSLLFDLI